MKKSEVKMILILLLVGVVIVGGLLLWRRGDNTGGETTNLGQQEQVQQPQQPSEDEQNVEEYVQVLDDGSKLNVSEQFSKTKTLDGLEFGNMQFKSRPGDSVTELLLDVENKSGVAITKTKGVIIDLLDAQGEVITSFAGDVNPVEPGQKVQLNASLGGDFSNAYDFKVRNQ